MTLWLEFRCDAKGCIANLAIPAPRPGAGQLLAGLVRRAYRRGWLVLPTEHGLAHYCKEHAKEQAKVGQRPVRAGAIAEGTDEGTG